MPLKMTGKLGCERGGKSKWESLNITSANGLLDVAQPALGVFQSQEIGDERTHDTDEEEEHQA